MSAETRETQWLELDEIADGLAAGAGGYTPYQPSVDASTVAMVNLGRCYGARAFSAGGCGGSGGGGGGGTSGGASGGASGGGGGGGGGGGNDEELLRPCDEAVLPAVLMYMSIKLDENFPSGCLLPRILAAFHVRGVELCRDISKEMEKLEFRICESLRFAVLPETPISFLHLFIARAVSENALIEDQTASIGELAAKTSLRWMRAGYLAVARPSEMAGAAFELAVFRKRGAKAAARVCRAAGCPIGASNNAMPLCRVFRNRSVLLSRAPQAKKVCARKVYGGRGDRGGGTERVSGGGGGGGDDDTSGANGRGWLRPIPALENVVRNDTFVVVVVFAVDLA